MAKKKNRDSRRTASAPAEIEELAADPQGEEPTETSKPAPARSLNRWRVGTLSILQLLLLAVALLAINYLSLNYPKRIDLSRNADYSLSSATKNYLDSEAVQGREDPIKMFLVYRRTSPFYERVRALCEQYASQSGGKIELTVIENMEGNDATEKFCAAYGLTLLHDLILIDARSDDSPVTTELQNRSKVLNPHIKIVTSEHLLAFEIIGRERKITGFRGEDMLTARIVESIEGRPRRMALIADKSRIGRRDSSPTRKTLEDVLRYQNIALGEVQIAGADKVSEDIEGLVIFNPQYDFSEEEIAALEDYWSRPRSAMLVLLGDQEVPPRFRSFLRKQGVTPRNDRVIGRSKNGWVTQAMATFTEGIPFTRELARQTTEFGGASSSMEIREGAEDLLNRRINPMALLEVQPGFWGESEFGVGEASYDERSDHAAPLHIAAAVTRGAASDDRFAADTSRMVVITNTDFLDPTHHRALNLDFLSNSANWLVGRDAMTGVTPRAITTYKLPLLQSQATFINRLNLIFMPLLLMIAGGFVWSSRRA